MTRQVVILWHGHPVIRQIIDRCHVGESNLSVCRYAVSRLEKKWKTVAEWPVEKRRGFLAECIRVHAENRKLYRDVMSGRLGD